MRSSFRIELDLHCRVLEFTASALTLTPGFYLFSPTVILPRKEVHCDYYPTAKIHGGREHLYVEEDVS